MATVTINEGPVKQGNGLLCNFASAAPPFQKDGGIVSMAKTIADGDYASGDDIIIKLHNIKSIEFAIAVDETGAILEYVEAALSVPEYGRKLTFSSVTASKFQLYVVYKA